MGCVLAGNGHADHAEQTTASYDFNFCTPTIAQRRIFPGKSLLSGFAL